VTAPGLKSCPPADPAPRPPTFAMPPDACDTHAHIFGPAARYAWSPQRGYTPPEALPAAYERLHAVLGVTRGVITQPSVYGTDNRATLDYVASRPDRLRAIVSVGPQTEERTLQAMHAQGARGIRVNIADSGGNPFASFAELRGFADRLKPLGWHVEFLLHVHEIDDVIDDIRRMPVDVSVGHFGYMPAKLGADHPKYRAFLDLVAEGRCWVKLSGAYRITARQRTPYDDTVPFARALVAQRPDRVLWGTDWPHPICPVPMPNDGDLADMLLDWVPDEAVRRRILVDNPAGLYGFAA
jgi:predicted TIM-barrel fold metal-dependent hydrolase